MKLANNHLSDANLFKQALACLQIKDPQKKIVQVNLLREQWQLGLLNLNKLDPVIPLPIPGRPANPVLVNPRQVPRRSFAKLAGRLSLVHAIVHIEFNAINLALDAVYRFQSMPEAYYTDWCQIAVEESQHFCMLSEYLNQHDMKYGDLKAHNGLWEMALKTDFDVMVRMALVPRVLEARGLDVTPVMIKKLTAVADTDLVKILQKIFDEEIGHVRTGTYWFNTLCHQRGLVPEDVFSQLLDTYMQNASFGPFDMDARFKAGFNHREMQNLISRM